MYHTDWADGTVIESVEHNVNYSVNTTTPLFVTNKNMEVAYLVCNQMIYDNLLYNRGTFMCHDFLIIC